METNPRDRITATLTPAVVLATAYLSNWLSFFMPVILYFLFRKLALELSRSVALKVFDLSISMVIFGLAIGAIVGALRIVARDGGFTIPLVSDGLLVVGATLLAAVYCLASLLVLSVKAFQGKEHTPGLSMGIFEALRGKRARAA